MILAITGQMRSGTSAMAEAVHMLGFPVAKTILPPYPPSWRAEWEDLEFSEMLMREDGPEYYEVYDYLEGRKRLARTLYNTNTFAIKSPFLALHQEQIKVAAARLGEEVHWIVMGRPSPDVDESLARYPWLSAEKNREIEAALPVGLAVWYPELVCWPRAVLGDLVWDLGLQGLVSTNDLKRAADSIKPDLAREA